MNDFGALLGHSYPLSDGSRVRLRLARSADAPAVRALLAQEGAAFDSKRLLAFDPWRRAVICATALVGSSERVVGVGAIDLRTGAAVLPDVLLVEPGMPGELRELLFAALLSRARGSAAREAA